MDVKQEYHLKGPKGVPVLHKTKSGCYIFFSLVRKLKFG